MGVIGISSDKWVQANGSCVSPRLLASFGLLAMSAPRGEGGGEGEGEGETRGQTGLPGLAFVGEGDDDGRLLEPLFDRGRLVGDTLLTGDGLVFPLKPFGCCLQTFPPGATPRGDN